MQSGIRAVRCRFSLTNMHRHVHIGQHGTQCGQAQHDVFRFARVAHQADAPDLASERSETSTNFEVELVEQGLSDFGLTRLHFFRNVDRIHLRQSGAFLDQEFESHRFEAGLECKMVAHVARP